MIVWGLLHESDYGAGDGSAIDIGDRKVCQSRARTDRTQVGQIGQFADYNVGF